jgi:plastocyanin
LSPFLLFAALSMAFVDPIQAAAAQTGAVEGTVEVHTPPPRRTANRYASGRVQAAKKVQRLRAVVYLVGDQAGPFSPSAALTMTQTDTAFVPSTLAVPTGTTVEFPNGDPFFHNVFSYSQVQRFDLGRYPIGQSKAVTFNDPGIVKIYCEVHDFMRAAVLVLDTPHFAVVDEDGSFAITGVPPGDYELIAWHADLDQQDFAVTVRAGATERIEVALR